MGPLANLKHEKFCQLMASGTIGKQAAYAATYKNNSSGASAVSATALLKKPKIRERIAELSERIAAKAETKAAWTAADRLKMLEDIAARCSWFEPKTAVSAVGEANKMQGSYAPNRSEITGKDGEPLSPPVTRIEIVAAVGNETENED